MKKIRAFDIQKKTSTYINKIYKSKISSNGDLMLFAALLCFCYEVLLIVFYMVLHARQHYIVDQQWKSILRCEEQQAEKANNVFLCPNFQNMIRSLFISCCGYNWLQVWYPVTRSTRKKKKTTKGSFTSLAHIWWVFDFYTYFMLWWNENVEDERHEQKTSLSVVLRYVHCIGELLSKKSLDTLSTKHDIVSEE